MDKLHLDQHISRQYTEELEQLRERVLEMGVLVAGHVDDSLDALLGADASRGRALDGADDHVDALERALDDDCQQILARRQPAAIDLRLVISVLKTITDFERMGDEAQKMARLTVRRGESGRAALPHADKLAALGAHVGRMLEDMLGALAGLDAARAYGVCKEDEALDTEYRALVAAVIPDLAGTPEDALDVIWGARALERIADHACNVCEYLIYLLAGEDVRHAPLEEVARAVTALAESADLSQ